MVDYIVTDGPLVANMENPDGSRFNGGVLPTGTTIFGTGRTDGVWIEGSSPYQKSKGVTAWYHKDYISPISSATKVLTPTQQREEKALNWFWGVAGRQLDVDKVPYEQPFQCVDVPKDMGNKLFGAPLRAYGDGKDVAYNMGALPGWTRLQYKSGMMLHALDVLSWGDPWAVVYEKQPDGSKKRVVYGHTAVQMKDSKTPIVAQQNGFDRTTTVTQTTLDTEGLLWVARPPFISKTVPVGAASIQTHTIQAGDTMWSIGIRYGVDVKVLRALNPGVDPTELKPGSKIRVG